MFGIIKIGNLVISCVVTDQFWEKRNLGIWEKRNIGKWEKRNIGKWEKRNIRKWEKMTQKEER